MTMKSWSYIFAAILLTNTKTTFELSKDDSELWHIYLTSKCKESQVHPDSITSSLETTKKPKGTVLPTTRRQNWYTQSLQVITQALEYYMYSLTSCNG